MSYCSNIPAQFTTLNQKSAIAQLQLLGYTESDPIYLRAIKEGAAQKIQARNWSEIPWKRLQALQQQGFNLYLVVNGCGHTDADVTTGKAVFYEHDKLSKDIQKDLWQSLGLPQPTLQVDTGGKSIHSYWVFDHPIPIEQWKQLQTDLLEYSDGDRSIKNPSRVMRLAGSIHTKTGQPAAIISQSGKRYIFEELREIVPAAAPAVTPVPAAIEYQSSHIGAVPLENCLAVEYRDWLANGVAEGGRNELGAKLTRDLIGTAARLDYLGIRYDGNPRQLLDDYGSRCNPPLPAREIDTIWKSAQKSNPTACLDDEKLINCVKAWQKNQQAPKATGQCVSGSVVSAKNPFSGNGGNGGNNNNGNIGNSPIDPDDKFRLDLLAYLDENNPYKKIRLKGEICSNYRVSAKDLQELIAEISQKNKAPKATIFNGAEFLKLESEGLQWLIPGIFPARGVTIVAGDAGAGKTTLAYDLAASILYQEEFLGEMPSKQGKVLFVSSDEQPCFAQDKLINRGFKFDDQWQFIIDWDVTQKDTLEETIEDLRPQLVVVDSFAAIHRDAAFDENSSQAKSSIYWLESLASKYQCGILLIHHANKNKEQKGVSKLRGSTAIAAACSAVLLLSGDGDIKTLSSPKIRGAEPFKWGIKLDPENGRFKVVDGKVDDLDSRSLGDRIMAIFEFKYLTKRLETALIHEEVGGTKEAVWKALDRLTKRGLLVKRPSERDNRARVYGLPKSHPVFTRHLEKSEEVLSPPHNRSSLSINMDEIHIQQGSQILDTTGENTRQILDLFDIDSKKSDCLLGSNLDTTMDLDQYLTQPIADGGERVSSADQELNSEVKMDTMKESVVSGDVVADCVDYIKIAIADNTPETAKDIQAILVGLRDSYTAQAWSNAKKEIWAALMPDEQQAFKSLLG